MKERPILFSAPMVRALLAGRKTQTRRIVSHPIAREPEMLWNAKTHLFYLPGSTVGVHVPCLYGVPGDRMWVRETWAPGPSVYPFDAVVYRADTSPLAGDDPATADHVQSTPSPHPDCYACERERCGFRWRPSIHMPRKASRIQLEVTAVRVERLQSITAADACAEGAAELLDSKHPLRDRVYEQHGKWTGKPKLDVDGPYAGAVEAFATLWDSINGERASWASNPFVWCISFRLVQP